MMKDERMKAVAASQRVDHESMTHLEALIAKRTGLRLRPRQRERLQQYLSGRLGELQLSRMELYIALLQEENVMAPLEWDRLISPLLNKESYFLRDKGQIALLLDQILPELIARNAATRKLRLWSAGCSTGEEAYSLALLVDELFSKMEDSARNRWDVRIFGTDIDEQAIAFARRGIYGAWSFRMVSPAVRDRWFHRKEEGWELDQAPRSMVEFARCNLVKDSFPSENAVLREMDLILCRNVFIYFFPETVATVISKFAQTLRPGGYLMTGHVESFENVPPNLLVRGFPESEIYQRCNPSETPHRTPRGVEPAEKRERQLGLDEFSRVLAPPEKSNWVSLAHSLPPENRIGEVAVQPPTPISGRALADIGRYDEAIAVCLRNLESNPFAFEPYELLASIAIEQGRDQDAKVFLKKAIYLAPSSPHLYIELGNFYESQRDLIRARKMFRAALELLEKMPPSQLVSDPKVETVATAADCIAHLSKLNPEGA
jgi:chemotaxis protein methyltransferase CheR